MIGWYLQDLLNVHLLVELEGYLVIFPFIRFKSLFIVKLQVALVILEVGLVSGIHAFLPCYSFQLVHLKREVSFPEISAYVWRLLKSTKGLVSPSSLL